MAMLVIALNEQTRLIKKTMYKIYIHTEKINCFSDLAVGLFEKLSNYDMGLLSCCLTRTGKAYSVVIIKGKIRLVMIRISWHAQPPALVFHKQ